MDCAAEFIENLKPGEGVRNDGDVQNDNSDGSNVSQPRSSTERSCKLRKLWDEIANKIYIEPTTFQELKRYIQRDSFISSYLKNYY